MAQNCLFRQVFPPLKPGDTSFSAICSCWVLSIKYTTLVISVERLSVCAHYLADFVFKLSSNSHMRCCGHSPRKYREYADKAYFGLYILGLSKYPHLRPLHLSTSENLCYNVAANKKLFAVNTLMGLNSNHNIYFNSKAFIIIQISYLVYYLSIRCMKVMTEVTVIQLHRFKIHHLDSNWACGFILVFTVLQRRWTWYGVARSNMWGRIILFASVLIHNVRSTIFPFPGLILQWNYANQVAGLWSTNIVLAGFY